jgi:hypothetical protein
MAMAEQYTKAAWLRSSMNQAPPKTKSRSSSNYREATRAKSPIRDFEWGTGVEVLVVTLGYSFLAIKGTGKTNSSDCRFRIPCHRGCNVGVSTRLPGLPT